MSNALFLLGPTASGKHEVAVHLAERLGAEIISIDSMKVYRGMDIGTAKPPAEVLQRIRHHLIDICDPSESYNAGRFVEDAAAAEAEVRSRGRFALFVGGTALYYKAYVYGLFRSPKADPKLRESLMAVVGERGSAALHEELSRIDPDAARRIHPNDVKRLVRAVEVHRMTGRPISSLQTQFAGRSRSDRVFVLKRERAGLERRIAQRTKRMFEAGLVEEVRGLMTKPWGKEGRLAVGYREVVSMIEGGLSREEAEEEINRNTRKFVRRQGTWFRSFREAESVEVAEGASLGRVADDIAQRLSRER